MRPSCSILAALLCSACAQNAVLDLDVELPAAGTLAGSTPIEAVTVQLDSDTADFDSDWAAGLPRQTVSLDATRTTLQLSVLAQPDHVERSLALRVYYCTSLAACEATPVEAQAELRVVMPRAFYRGVATRYRLVASSPPDGTTPGVLEVDPCDVAGCRDGEMASWCEGGVHLCDR